MNISHNIIKTAICADFFTPMQKDVLSMALEGLHEVGPDLDSLTDYVLESISGMRQCFMYSDAEEYYRLASTIDAIGYAQAEEDYLSLRCETLSIADLICCVNEVYLQTLAHEICSRVADVVEDFFIPENAGGVS